MTDPGRWVVLNHLIRTGWEEQASGPVGEIWTRGDEEAVIPYKLEVGTSRWNRVALALAQADNQPVDEILDGWLSEMRRYVESVEQQVRQRLDAGRVELELHLDGPTVKGHETSAYSFGRFVMRTSESVKELVKSSLGLSHYSRDLLVSGGPGPGSVKVTFTEPDRSDPTAMLPEAPETAEGQALLYMAGVFAAAESMVDQVEVDALRSRLAPLRVGARLSVARLADVVTEGGWNLTGVIRRGSEEETVMMGLAGARILGQTSREQQPEERVLPFAGTLDGWRWSRSELTLITDDRRTLYVSVPMELQARVADLNSTAESRVLTQLLVYTNVARGTSDAVSRTYALRSIQPEMDQPLWNETP